MDTIKTKRTKPRATEPFDEFHEVMPLARPYRYDEINLRPEVPLEPIETEQAAKSAAIRILVFLALTTLALCAFLAWSVQTVQGFSL
ncbi:MAG TPA: hypothetical protein VLI05_04010 [Candidatus Saccharimonadia bacterium]|nr:hypothetical protein [Candidatus Saccharimonadia bacterium]